MKHLLIVLFNLLSTHFLLGQELKIATFNCEFLIKRKVHVKFGLPFDLRSQPDSVKQFWADATNRDLKFEEAADSVAKHIKQIDADIIGLTEVGNEDDVEVLVQKIKNYGLDYRYVRVCKSTDSSTGQHVAILSKHRLRRVEYAFSDRGLYFIEADKDEVKETGISKGMKATVKVSGVEINLFLLHLKSERGSYESDQQRIKQAEIIRNLTLPYIKDNKHVVVMGDFNSEKRHDVLLTLRGFKDIYEELVQTGDTYYFKDFSTRWTYQFQGNKEQIDHILLSIPLTRLCYRNTSSRFGITSTIIETDDKFVSDHNALLVHLIFR